MEINSKAGNKIGSAADLREKLGRTFYRRPSYQEDQIDWLFDMCITAYHLIEWVWHEHKSQASKKYASLDAFRQSIYAECPQLKVCRLVANGAKHRRDTSAGKKPSVLEVEKNVQISSNKWGQSKPFNAGDPGPIDLALTPDLEITLPDGTKVQGSDLASAVHWFWARYEL